MEKMDLKKWQRQKKAHNIVDVLNKKGYTAIYAENGEEALSLVNKYIVPGSIIAFGGSITLKEYGITQHLLSDKYNAIDRYSQPDFEAEVERSPSPSLQLSTPFA